MKILVVGGGTAGLISAIVLKKRLNVEVDLVFSKEIGIIGVGEGSTEHFRDFMTFAGIDQYDLLKKCDATYKAGVKFEGWTKDSYIHHVGVPYNSKYSQYSYVYANQISKNSKYIMSNLILEDKINKWFVNKNNEFPFNQFHFSTHKLNEYLVNFAKKLGIVFYEDEIKNVNFDSDGNIESVLGKNKKYKYDFYIDSTGFRKILIGKMNSKWISFEKYLKMKSAIVFPDGDSENYSLCTTAKAMDYGWMFRIPTWGRHGNGYIYDSDYIDADKAKIEVEKTINKEIEVSKQFNFNPGYLENVWIKNCCAIGLSGSFVEPMEATSIGTSIQQSFLLMHKIINYDENTINQYNKTFSKIMENIRDFVVLHYITDKNNSLFWKDISKIEIPDSLNDKLLLWKNKLPIKEDFSNFSEYVMFSEDSYTVVLYGLGLINTDSVKKEYQSQNVEIKKLAEKTIKNEIFIEKNMEKITHKNFLKIIRENF